MAFNVCSLNTLLHPATEPTQNRNPPFTILALQPLTQAENLKRIEEKCFVNLIYSKKMQKFENVFKTTAANGYQTVQLINVNRICHGSGEKKRRNRKNRQ